MLRDEAVSAIAGTFGNRTDLDAAIIAALRYVQPILESGDFQPWFMETELVSSTSQANEYRVLLPTDFVKEIDDESLWVVDADGGHAEVPKKLLFQLRKRYGVSTGLPKAFALSGSYLLLFPTPDQAYALSWRYYANQALVSDTMNEENIWLKYAPDWLMGAAGAYLARQKRDDKAMQIFTGIRDEGKARVQMHHIDREVAATNDTFGGIQE